MPRLPSPESASFADFGSLVLGDDFVEQLSLRVGWEERALRDRLGLALGEAAQTLRVLDGLTTDPDGRILEVGAGLGLTSTYLSSAGFDVVALEPAGVGFDEHESLAQHVAELVGSGHEVLGIGAEDLRPAEHGKFDVIFSNNVIEHVDTPAAIFRAMRDVLEPAGIMIHSCPNYSIPFEPHFGIPLLPIRPQWTSRVLPRSIAASEVWRSLNFVRARDVIEIAARFEMLVEFRSGSLASSLDRLGHDDEFRDRHRLLAVVARMLAAVGLISLIRRLPATWSTPMDFAMSDPGGIARLKEWAASVDLEQPGRVPVPEAATVTEEG